MDSLSAPSILLLLFLPLLFSFLCFLWDHEKKAVMHQPGLKPYPLVGHLPQFLANRHRIVDWIAEVLTKAPTNTVVFHRFGGIRGVLTANPTNVEHILRTHFENYPKGEQFSSVLHDFLGTGIFNSDGETWRVQRKIASFEFTTRTLRSFVVECVNQEIQTRLLPLLAKASAIGQVVDLQDVFERFAFDNICQVSFDLDPGYLNPELEEASVNDKKDFATTFPEAFRDASFVSAERFRYAIPGLFKIKKLFNIGSEKRLQESISIVHNFADQIIRSRKEEKQNIEKHDLLSRFVASSENYSDKFLRDIVISFLLAGRETTSSALSWFFWILSSRPDVEARILEEIHLVRTKNRVSNTGGYEFEDLKEMPYLHAAITESMRLFPPVPVNQVDAIKDDVLPDGTSIKKGWFISYNAYAMGRMESNWGKDCTEYRPERWIDADGTFRQESPFKFIAFHAGARMCLGKEMAYIQMKSVIASILDRFVTEVEENGTCPVKVISLTLRMKDGLPVRVRERNC